MFSVSALFGSGALGERARVVLAQPAEDLTASSYVWPSADVLHRLLRDRALVLRRHLHLLVVVVVRRRRRRPAGGARGREGVSPPPPHAALHAGCSNAPPPSPHSSSRRVRGVHGRAASASRSAHARRLRFGMPSPAPPTSRTELAVVSVDDAAAGSAGSAKNTPRRRRLGGGGGGCGGGGGGGEGRVGGGVGGDGGDGGRALPARGRRRLRRD